jgi:hypothetical protein
MGRTAGIGGFILSLPIFMQAQIKSTQQIYAASFAPAVSFFIFSINDYIKNHFFTNYKSELTTDQATVDEAITNLKHLHIDTELKKNENIESYNKILEILSFSGIDLDKKTTDINKLTTVIDHCLQDNSVKEKTLRYATNAIDYTSSTLTGMSAVFIPFVVPIVLKNEYDNENINHTALVLAILFALYSGCSALANSEKDWRNLNKDKSRLKASIDQYCTLYRSYKIANQDQDSEDLEKISNVVKRWEAENRTGIGQVM